MRKEDYPVFHFKENVTLGEIQLSAKQIKASITQDPYRSNTALLTCPIPIEADGEWEKLEKKYGMVCLEKFYVETPNWGCLEYSLTRSSQILDLEANLHLATAQKTFEKISKDSSPYDIDDADSLVNAFILINNSISNFFFNQAYEKNVFDWNEKYSPCFFDRKGILQFRGNMMLEPFRKVDKQKLRICKKYMMKDFAMLTKYLTFWVSLLDVATFPGLQENYRVVYDNLLQYLLKKYANIRIYDIIAESDVVSNGNDTSERGANSNTTRLKIFFTTNDDIPQMIRLDLPHVGCPYVHLNIQNVVDEDNVHVRLSEDESTSGEYDNLFEPLLETLRLYNFYSISTHHSPVSEDKQIFLEMKYMIAMYNYAVVAWGYLLIGEDSEIDDYPIVKQSRKQLLELLEQDGIEVKDAEKLNPYDLYEFADAEIQRNKFLL